MIHVLATISLHPGKREQWLEEFKQLRPLVQAEAGCIEYDVAIDLPTGLAAQPPINENEAVVIEKWESLEALKAHLSAKHMEHYREQVAMLVAGVSLRVLSPVAAP
ncbi:MAG: putative quinol monooxygenase [Gemmataceae bacterium]